MMAKATSSDSTATRVRRSPAERAQADLDKAQKAVDKATARVQKLGQDLTEAQGEQNRSQKFLDYAKANPDLPDQGVSGEDGVGENATATDEVSVSKVSVNA